LVSQTTSAHTKPTLSQGIVTEIGNGQYNVEYIVRSGEKYDIYVTFDGESIPGSSFELNVISDIPNSLFTIATGDGIKTSVKNTESIFVIQTSDIYGNIIKNNTMNENFNIYLTTTEKRELNMTSILFDIINNFDGTYTISYIAPSLSNYYLHIDMNEESIRNSPYMISSLDPIVMNQSIRVAFWVLVSICIVIVLILGILTIICKNNP
jgi:hypothetical protein